MRAGSRTLTTLAASRNFLILQSLADGARSQIELRRDVGLPAKSTLRAHLLGLESAGAITGRRGNSFRGVLDYQLTQAGQELFAVSTGMERWLAQAPSGVLELGGDPAKAAIKGLVGSWTATVLTTLAATGPLSLTELDDRISTMNYPTIGRCLEAMRIADQLDMGTPGKTGTPYGLTDWLRRGIAPLALAARWELGNVSEGAAGITRLDIEGALQLAGPLCDLPLKVSGVCQVAMQVRGAKEQRDAVLIEALNGGILSSPAMSERKPGGRASGTVDNWFSALIDADSGALSLEGDTDLSVAILDSLNRALFDST